jgi:uncharacterized membrane protein (DUF4010 family)
MSETLDVAVTLLTSAAIGLLVGLERERNPLAKAGLRTFALIALLGSLTALLARHTDSGWLLAAAALVVGAALAGAYFVDPATLEDDSGTTTVVAALVVYCIGALNVFGFRTLAMALGISVTALLHFKVELEGAARRLTPTDIRSMLQFGAVSAVVLPLLPDEPMGPYGVLNPFHVWLMVVLVSGVSLAGYVAWRLTQGRGDRAARGSLLLAGVLGGLVSSTATTLVYARQARDGTHTYAASLIVILLANGTMLLRVLLIASILAVPVALALSATLLPALVLAAPAVIGRWRHASGERGDGTEGYRNPTHLLAAVAFAAMYAGVLFISAWLSENVGTEGVYGLALVSGLTDVDAITLSLLQLFNQSALGTRPAVTAITLAVGANLVLKAVLVWIAGGAGIGRAAAIGFVGPLLGLGAGLAALYALA